MSRNGSGTYSLPAGNPVVSGTTITTTWANTTLNDIASSLTGSVAADGQTPMTGALNMGSNKIIAVTDPTNAQDAATKSYTDAAITGLSSTYLQKANNLSDVTSVSTSRTNLGLGTIATQAASAVAVTGGAIDGTTVGTTTRSSVKATTLDLGLSTQSVAIGQGNASIMKNRIINGAMVIDQRNAGASVTGVVGSVYTLDRWKFYCSQASKLTVQQSSTTPAGFSNSLLTTSSSAYSITSTDEFDLYQLIEGFNTADLNWGTANAKTVTLSFQVYSSVTGTFGGVLRNSAGNYSYPFTYTVSSANTWTSISITVAGPTSGTWIGATNGIGITVLFSMGAGSTLLGTAGSWSANAYAGATGQTNLVSTNGATFYITGVQLEVGSSATGFEYVNYQTSLSNCMRYYEKSWDAGTAVGTATLIGLKYSSASAGANTTGYLADGIIYQVPKRATPTVTTYDNAGNSGKLNRENIGVGTTNNVTSSTSPIGTSTCFIYTSGSATANGISYQYTLSAEL